jgi:hypothetical protein
MENSTQEEGRDEVTTNEMMTPTANANAHVQANANSQPSQMVEPADTPSSRRRRATTLNADDEAEVGDEDEDEDDSDDEDDDEEDEDEDDEDDDAPVFMSMPPRQANANANANQQVRGMASVVYGGYASRYSRGPRHGTLPPCTLFIYQFIYKIAYPVIIYLAINIYLYLRVKTNFFKYDLLLCDQTSLEPQLVRASIGCSTPASRPPSPTVSTFTRCASLHTTCNTSTQQHHFADSRVTCATTHTHTHITAHAHATTNNSSTTTGGLTTAAWNTSTRSSSGCSPSSSPPA